MEKASSVKLNTLPDDLRKIADRLLNKKFGTPIAGEVVGKTPETVSMKVDPFFAQEYSDTRSFPLDTGESPHVEYDPTFLGHMVYCRRCRAQIAVISGNAIEYSRGTTWKYMCIRCNVVYSLRI